MYLSCLFSFFFFTSPATTEIYTLSLHDALPISTSTSWSQLCCAKAREAVYGMAPSDPAATAAPAPLALRNPRRLTDRKSTRLNSSHVEISYAVFCLKKKTKKRKQRTRKQSTNRE